MSRNPSVPTRVNVDEHFLTNIARQWVSRLERDDRIALAHSRRRRYSWGSLCSGSDVAHFVLQGVVEAINIECEHDSGTMIHAAHAFPQEFNCDINGDVRRFLQLVSDARFQFEDCTVLASGRAIDVIAGDIVTIPSVLFPGSRLRLQTPFC